MVLVWACQHTGPWCLDAAQPEAEISIFQTLIPEELSNLSSLDGNQKSV